MTFEYEVLRPSGELQRYVEQVWFARGTIRGARERIAPTGSTVLGFVLGQPLAQWPRNGGGERFTARRGFLIGPHDQPIVNQPTDSTWAVGIVMTPVGCRAALGLDPAPLRGAISSPDSWAAFGSLRSRLQQITDARPALDLVEHTLAVRLDTRVPGLDRVEAAVAVLTADPTVAIATLAGDLGVSHGHLDREFRRIVGLGPRVLARILRLRKLLESIDVYGRVEWTRLATDLGWFDQAHLIRDFRRHTGVAPSEYAAAQREVYSPDEAQAGFVPDVTTSADST